MLEQVKTWICPLIRINTGVLPWLTPHPPTNFRGYAFSCFCLILLTNKQTAKRDLLGGIQAGQCDTWKLELGFYCSFFTSNTRTVNTSHLASGSVNMTQVGLLWTKHPKWYFLTVIQKHWITKSLQWISFEFQACLFSLLSPNMDHLFGLGTSFTYKCNITL